MNMVDKRHQEIFGCWIKILSLSLEKKKQNKQIKMDSNLVLTSPCEFKTIELGA